VLIDAYGHVSLPRQMRAADFVEVMDQNGVDQALVCTAETCPDLRELSRAACELGDRLRVAGLPVGDSAEVRLESLVVQMESGFIGARLQAGMVAREPRLLEPIGLAGGIAIVVGGDAFRVCAGVLTAFLGQFPASHVWGAHFGEPGPATSVSTDGALKALFGHPRFAVICSRHGAQSPAVLEPWVTGLVEHLGWDKLLFGSEYPVAAWRNELYAETIVWMDRFGPTPDQRRAYLGGNAHRMLFSRPAARCRPLGERWTRFTPRPDATVPLFANTTLDMPEALHQQLFRAYLAEPPATRGRYGDFLLRLLARSARR
jgi:hypothetical protein